MMSDDWFKPVWEDDEEGIEPVGNTPIGSMPLKPILKSVESSDYIAAIGDAENALGRLDATVEALNGMLRSGIVSRMVYREASGWLALASQWIHPTDLALRDCGMTGSYTAAAISGRLGDEMPQTSFLDDDEDFYTVPEDGTVSLALIFAKYLRRLGEMTTWEPLKTDSEAKRVFGQLGLDSLSGYYFDKWKGEFVFGNSLSDALRGALSWRMADNSENSAEIDLRASFVMASLIKSSGKMKNIPLPFWSARPAMNIRKSETPFGVNSQITCLKLMAESSRSISREILRLSEVWDKGYTMYSSLTKRSKLLVALEMIIRIPVLTPKMLAKSMHVSQRSATGLLGQLEKNGLIREATGRKSFRAFVV